MKIGGLGSFLSACSEVRLASRAGVPMPERPRTYICGRALGFEPMSRFSAMRNEGSKIWMALRALPWGATVLSCSPVIVVDDPENDFWAMFRMPVTTTLPISLTAGSMWTLILSSSLKTCLPLLKTAISWFFMPRNENERVMSSERRALRVNLPSGPVTAPRLACLSTTLTPASGSPFSS